MAGPPVLLRRCFIRDFHEAELQEDMERLLRCNESWEAEAIRKRGLWTEPVRQRSNTRSKKVSFREKAIMQQVFTRSYVTGKELQRWGYKCTGVCPWCGGR